MTGPVSWTATTSSGQTLHAVTTWSGPNADGRALCGACVYPVASVIPYRDHPSEIWLPRCRRCTTKENRS